MGSWVTQMNKLEIEVFDTMYTELIKIYEVYDERLLETFNKEFARVYDSIEDMDNSTLPEEFINLNDYIDVELDRIDKMLLNLVVDSAETIFLSNIANRKQLLLFKRRVGLICTKITNYVGNFHSMMLSDASILLRTLLDSLNDFVDSHSDEIVEGHEEELLESSIDQSGFRFRKLFDYKDMIAYAEDNGFVYKGSNGDHRLYEHETTNKVVVIPAHTLGTGISYKIQKQIEYSCVEVNI